MCRNEDYALAIVDGAFTKALEIQLVRKVSAAHNLPLATLSMICSHVSSRWAGEAVWQVTCACFVIGCATADVFLELAKHCSDDLLSLRGPAVQTLPPLHNCVAGGGRVRGGNRGGAGAAAADHGRDGDPGQVQDLLRRPHPGEGRRGVLPAPAADPAFITGFVVLLS